MTLLLCAVAIPLGVVGGMALALMSTVNSRLVRWSAIVYTDLFRAFPPLVLLLFIAYGLPFLGFKPPPSWPWPSPSCSTPAATTARSCAPASNR
jgi:polar amino acid transport system permease protein